MRRQFRAALLVAVIGLCGALAVPRPAAAADTSRVVYVGPSSRGTYRVYVRDTSGQLQPTNRVVYLRRASTGSDVQTSTHRLGTARYRGHSASGIGAGSFLIGGPVGWGIYRAVDIFRHR